MGRSHAPGVSTRRRSDRELHLDWKQQSDTFESLAGYYGNAFNLTGEGEPERLDGIQTTPNLFPLVGVQPLVGRWFNDSEGLPEHSEVTILSYGLWQRKFGGDLKVAGRTVVIDDRRFVIVGVMPKGFQFPREDTQLWTPVQFTRQQSDATGRNVHFLKVIGRLKPAIPWQQAESQVRTIAMRLGQSFPSTNKDYSATVVPLQQEFVRDAQSSLLLLLAAALVVLAIACANVANMLMTRAASRTREVAIRTALGATRMRVARQLFVERLPLAICGSILGVFIAEVAFRFLERLIPPALFGAVSPSLDFRLLGFTVSISLVTAIAFGVAPLLKLSARISAIHSKREAHPQTVSVRARS